MKKTLALTLALALALTACTSQAKDSSQSGENKESSATEQKAENGAMEKFIIGSIGPTTGPAASYGTSVKQGSEIAINEINSAGGVKVGDKTYSLEFNFVDDEATPDKAITAYNSLIDSKMNVLLGCVTSGSSLAVSEKSAEDGILMITPSGSVPDITKPDNVFRLCFTDTLQGKTIAEFVANKGYKSVAILYDNSDEYSTGIYEAFKDELNSKGLSNIVVAVESFNSADVDYATQLTKIKSTGAEAIFVPAYYQAAAYITQQAKTAGIEADFIGSDGWDGVIAQVTDKEALEDAVFLSPFLATEDSAKSFVEQYQSKYKAVPDQFAADGYDTVYVIKAAMEKAGSIENDKLIAAMTEIKVDGLTGSVTFDKSGEPFKSAKFVTIKNGEYVTYKE
jgi:extracellular ligand-binding receptor